MCLLNGSDELCPSDNPWDWLGPGIYFWEQNPYRALAYAREAARIDQKFSGKIKTPFVWADGSCWAAEITALQAKGYHVISVQNPLTSLADDVATTKRAIDMVKGKVILVGHSWGGYVITQAGNDPKVVGLVYLAAFAPDLGETIPALSANAPQTELGKYFIPAGDFLFLSEEGIKTVFAGDLSAKQQGLVYATQIPAAKLLFAEKSEAPAWKQKPNWYIVAKEDKAINPDLERFMSKRMKATTIEIESSHVLMISHPTEVLRVIEEAAGFKY
jgi:pimeloyl-ACP methyl ester carboxylesterase